MSINYAKMTKKQREKEFMNVMDTIYNYMDQQDYYDMKEELEKEYQESNCNLDNFYYEDYSEEIDW